MACDTVQPVFIVKSNSAAYTVNEINQPVRDAMPVTQIKEDSIEELRFNMVECQLKPAGVRDYNLTDQIGRVQREAFVAGTAREIAYADIELVCSAGGFERKIMTPTAFALMAELAEIKADDVVLDIAGGSGYSAAVMAGLASTVIALEEDEAMVEKAGGIWQELGIDNAVAVQGALPDGQAKQGPFDVIFINGCIAQTPDALLAQLAEDGRLVCVHMVDGTQKAHIYRRIGDGISTRVAFDVAVPNLSVFDPAPKFEF